MIIFCFNEQLTEFSLQEHAKNSDLYFVIV